MRHWRCAGPSESPNNRGTLEVGRYRIADVERLRPTRVRGEPTWEENETHGATNETHSPGRRAPAPSKYPVKRAKNRFGGEGRQRTNELRRASSTNDGLETKNGDGGREISYVNMSPDLAWELRRRKLRCASISHE